MRATVDPIGAVDIREKFRIPDRGPGLYRSKRLLDRDKLFMSEDIVILGGFSQMVREQIPAAEYYVCVIGKIGFNTGERQPFRADQASPKKFDPGHHGRADRSAQTHNRY